MTTSTPEIRPDQERIVKYDAYRAFQEKEGIPVVTGFAVDDLRTVEVKPWARLECLGTYINLDGAGDTNGCLLYTSPSPRDGLLSRMPSSA